MDDQGARRLMASILKQAHEDYTKDKSCPEWCQFREECKEKKVDKNGCDAKNFIHSAWCATLCEGIEIDYQDYLKTCLEKHRLSKNVYRYIEGEIKDYQNIKKELTEFKSDIINESPISQEIRGTSTGDSTASKVIKISQNKKIIEMEKTIEAIEAVYKRVVGGKKIVMEEFWKNQYTNNGMSQKIGVDERTIRRWKRQIVYSVAIELNYL